MEDREFLLGIVDAASRLVAANPIPPSPEAKFALEQLTLLIGQYRRFQIEGPDDYPVPAARRVSPCNGCGAQVFLAAGPAGGLAVMEVDPVEASGVPPMWRYQLWVDGPQPVITLNPTLENGSVWIDHAKTCALGDGPKVLCAPYMRRWKANLKHLDRQAANLEASLRANIARLSS